MDSEGEEQTLKTYQGSTGEWGFLVLDGTRARERAQASVVSTYRRELRVSVQQSDFRTVNFVYYLDGVKSATLAFHYSAGNNFIKSEQWLKLAKGGSADPA